MNMRTTKEGIALIQSFESCALVAYQDQGGIWTLGWGRARGIIDGMTCTRDEADAWLLTDIFDFEKTIIALLPRIIFTDNQISAIVSFCYNVGFGEKGVKDGFHILKNGNLSTMFRCLQAMHLMDAAAEFPKWNKVAGVPCPGITRRRLAERALYSKPDVANAAAA